MKRIALTFALVFVALPLAAQESASSSANSGAAAGEVRIQSLEDKVRTLTEQVELLRAELQSMREVRTPAPAADAKLLLASSHVEPGTVPAAPEPSAGGVAAQPVGVAPPMPAQVTQTQTFGGATSNAKLLNPDISMIGDFIGTAGRNTVSPGKALELHESEVGMQAIIDPYARADVFISFGEEGVNVEEGYLTFTSLPAGLLMKVGKMRAEFGKVNTIHNHALSYIDRPLVTNNLVGGEDGIDDAGFSLSRFLPAPKNWFLQGTAQVYRGDSSDVFTANRRQDVSVVGHLRLYRDLGESTNIDLGGSYARGHNTAGVGTTFDPANFLTNLYSADATLRWKPLRRAIYHSFLFRTELFWSARDQLSPLNVFQTQHAFGLYSDAEYRVNRRWTAGGRFDRSGEATNANEFLFQFLFVMGAHGAHPF